MAVLGHVNIKYELLSELYWCHNKFHINHMIGEKEFMFDIYLSVFYLSIIYITFYMRVVSVTRVS